jgi:methionyl-tRNA formyltransferase
MKFAALGRTQMLFQSILACIDNGHELVLVGTSKASPEYTVNELDLMKLAKAYSAPFFCDGDINKESYVNMIRDSGAEIAISMNWATLIKQQILDQFKYGVINAHPGDLPRFRGNACPNWAILVGESQIVVTLHKMIQALDAGPIYLQRRYPIDENTYIKDIYDFLQEAIPQMFVELLNNLTLGKLIPHPQPEDPSLSLRCFSRLPIDGEIDWNKSAVNINRLVHASAEPFSGAYSYINNKKIIIWRARPVQLPYPYLGSPGQVAEILRDNGEIIVLTGNGELTLEEVEINDKRGHASDLILSTRSRLGIGYSAELLELKSQIEQFKKHKK